MLQVTLLLPIRLALFSRLHLLLLLMLLSILTSFDILTQDLTTGAVLLRAHSDNGVYPVRQPVPSPIALSAASVSLWHNGLGQCGTRVLDQLRINNSISGTASSVSDCIPCHLGKSQRLPFNKVFHNSP
ncbi:unnamed protein product, partial [Cuscuta epithymum]